MQETIDARDVLDPNARTCRAFRARILGHFRRIGPNKWDPYRFVHTDDDQKIDVLPGLKVQVEEAGAVFRIRFRGQVLRAEWQLPEIERTGPVTEARSRFMQTCVMPYRNAPGRGFKAVMASKLSGQGRGRR